MSEYEFILKEILNTETSYLNKIAVLNDCLAKPLLARKNVYTITDDPRVSIFLSSIAQIYQLNGEFIADLKQRGDNTVGDVLAKYALLFRCYRQYSKYFEVAKHVLQQDKSQKTVAFLEELKTDPKLENQTLESFLIKPIQRVPQYLLFIKQLMKCLPKDSPEVLKLQQAEDDLSASVAEINEAIRNRENIETLFQLEAQFKNAIPIFAVNRKFIKQAELSKVCRSYNKTYTFHLFSDMLTYSSSSPGNTFNLHRSIDLHQCMVRDVPDGKNKVNAFQITSQEKSFMVVCESPQQKAEWVGLISQSIQALKDEKAKAKLGKKGKVAEEKELAPVWTPDDDQETCSLCYKEFSVFVRRHHCRRCGRLVCHACSPNTRILANISGTKLQRVCEQCERIVDSESTSPKGADAAGAAGVDDFDEDLRNSFGVVNLFPDDPKYQLLRNLFITESSYVSKLEILHEIFVKPLLTASLTAGTSSMKTKTVKVYSGDQDFEIPLKIISGRLAAVLSEIENLFTLNSELLEDLESYLSKWDKNRLVGDLFSNYAPLFKLYGEFAKGYGYAVETFGSAEFKDYILKCQNDSRIPKDFNFNSYLEMPLERLPEYTSSVKQILEITDQGSKDYGLLLEVISKFEDAEFFISEAKRLDENQAKIREIEQKFTTDIHLAKHDREFIREGELAKVNRTGKPEKYIFHLFNDVLLYSEDVGKDRLKHHRTMELKGASVQNDPYSKVPHAFIISSQQKSFTVSAESAESKEFWMHDLMAAIENLKEARSSIANDTPLSEDEKFVAPVWKPDNQTTYCCRCYSDFSFAKRRHHCRVCGELVCGNCSNHKMIIENIDRTKPQRVCDFCVQNMKKPAVESSNIESSATFSNTSEFSKTKTMTKGVVVMMKPNESSNCLVCSKKFGMINSPKNCQKCGKLVCSSCSFIQKHTVDSGTSKEMANIRICTLCQPKP